jgi:hypothetical protein
LGLIFLIYFCSIKLIDFKIHLKTIIIKRNKNEKTNAIQIKKTISVAAEMVKLKKIVHLYKESENGVNLSSA